ncbi:virB8 family protein [Plesiomonas sp. ZOR0011]|uniref:virB8 family protein n=1 Tax=Plesiomonas sp. ZOR0011 TaxID=1339230 RepID=UPI000646A390|nr:type IV secretion system protein [Plesiomonas sp. ZOR0011]
MRLKPNNADEALDFEAHKAAMYASSNRRAWMISGASVGLVLILAGAIYGLTPLKSNEPFVLSVDKNSGQTEILTVLKDGNKAISSNRALDEYWIGAYVRWREVYDWYTIQQDYDSTIRFSSVPVQNEYKAIFEGDQALDALWGKRVKATVKILSIVTNTESKIATVRFEKTIKDSESNGKGQQTIWIATLGYRYKPQETLSVEDRRQNPWGFEVVSYRVDPENAP